MGMLFFGHGAAPALSQRVEIDQQPTEASHMLSAIGRPEGELARWPFIHARIQSKINAKAPVYLGRESPDAALFGVREPTGYHQVLPADGLDATYFDLFSWFEKSGQRMGERLNALGWDFVDVLIVGLVYWAFFQVVKVFG
ncbi:MAG: hypothetical protein ACOC7Q_02575 [bacterium]